MHSFESRFPLYFSLTMVNICLTCGDGGFSNALTFCNECKVYSVHLYCLAEIPTDFDDVFWLCEDCEPEARKLPLLDKCSPDSETYGNVQVKKEDSGRKLRKRSNRKVRSESLNGPKVPDLEKSSSIQLDSENIKKDEEYERHIRMDDKCITDEAVESLEGKKVQLDLGECQELEMIFFDNGEKDEKHGKQVILEEAESLNTKKTELDGQGMDLCQIDCSKDGEKCQRHYGCNSSAEVSLNAEARLLKTESHQLAITHSPDIYVPAQPIEQPIWRGHLCIPDEHFDGMLGLVAHLSNLACRKVGEEAKSLPLFLSPELLPRSTLWPKSFAKWGPSDDSIALYFFPDSESSERVFDSLVNDMICRDVGMRAVVQNAELLIFTSTLMPMDFWRFQSKFYMWGVFRRKRCGRSAAIADGVPVPGEVTQVSDRHSPVSPSSNTNRASASKNIVAGLKRGEKLNGDNYEMWSMKIQHVLEEQEALEAINESTDEPEEGTTAQHKRDRLTYDAWKKKNTLARITLLSSMYNDIMREFRKYDLAKDIWSAVADRFGATSVTRLSSLSIKFDSYKKRPDNTMRKHMRQMTNIRHLELEDNRLEPNKSSTDVHMTDFSSQVGNETKCKFQQKGGKCAHANKRKRFNKLESEKHRPKKKNIAKVKCFNCGNNGHFARDCTEPKKTHLQQTMYRRKGTLS